MNPATPTFPLANLTPLLATPSQCAALWWPPVQKTMTGAMDQIVKKLSELTISTDTYTPEPEGNTVKDEDMGIPQVAHDRLDLDSLKEEEKKKKTETKRVMKEAVYKNGDRDRKPPKRFIEQIEGKRARANPKHIILMIISRKERGHNDLGNAALDEASCPRLPFLEGCDGECSPCTGT
uniref:Uncharacterized protein n=1 Tax=Chromera velia CCMP2878 TaxID=1169474 RepID=A0A0G4FJ81_9ALVE|eukprot:Cvel_17333.t1-p1 / transcript=Cvel_17333.t1 / gene=Cvel_17333 / organism=Chromera_velia_CCMP2878 / gene_product=hypothetical protein / transcript_product=hypothetical protein / location=Cvel_scaffold1377:14412-17050(-) / protein_length=178 / sequence_SO=supercontig / SO=protein_coding / is_pseudo=false